MIRPMIRRLPSTGGHYVIVPKPLETGYLPLDSDTWPDNWAERPETHNAYGFGQRANAWGLAGQIARGADQ